MFKRLIRKRYLRYTLYWALISLISFGTADKAIAQNNSEKEKFNEALEESPVSLSNIVLDHRTHLDKDSVPELWVFQLKLGDPLKEDQYALVYKDEDGSYQFDRPSLHYADKRREETKRGYSEVLAGDVDGDGDQDITAKQDVGAMRLIAYFENQGSSYEKTEWRFNWETEQEQYEKIRDSYIYNDAMKDVYQLPIPPVNDNEN